MLVLFLSFICSWLTALLIVRFNHIHARFSADHDLVGVQKFHARPTPRIGGICLMMAVMVMLPVVAFQDQHVFKEFVFLWLCSLPAFLGGVVEDLTKKVGVLHRLGLTAASAGLGFFLLNAGLRDADFFLLDMMLAFSAVSFLFTAFAVAGVANSVNLIDGYNGLASMVSILIFVGLAYVGYQVADPLIWLSSLIMAGAVLGFFVWNYPRGLLFLGDGGAYFIGFMIGELSVLLLVRNPQVSSWFPLLLVFYPVFETIFTIYRRVIIRKSSPGLPDAVHMHQMIYMRLVRWAVGSKDSDLKTQRNSMTAPYLWTLSALTVVPAMLLWEQQFALMMCVVAFAVIYIALYRALVRFHAPKMLVRNTPPMFGVDADIK